MRDPATETSDERPLPYWAFGVIVVVYLAIIQLGGSALQHVGNHDNTFTTVEGVLWNMCLPLGIALVFTYAVIGALGWWRPVLRDDRPVRRWVWFVPVVFLICSLAAIVRLLAADRHGDPRRPRPLRRVHRRHPRLPHRGRHPACPAPQHRTRTPVATR